ncbi:MAG: hypothetical protein AB8B86_06645 [Pseudomonadales bacterium]
MQNTIFAGRSTPASNEQGTNIVPFALHNKQRNDSAEIFLGDSGSQQLELLFGALEFMNRNSNEWITWVNPPTSHRELFCRNDMDVSQLRLLYKDQQRSVFHLLYLALQASNSSWVIGPARELSFRETEILQQAAKHHGCRLLLLRERESLH